MKTYYVNSIVLLNRSYNVFTELCVACESIRLVAVVRVYFWFQIRLGCVNILELVPVLERKAEVDRKEKLLRDLGLGATFVVKLLLGCCNVP